MGHRVPTDVEGGFRAPLAFKVAGLTYRVGDYLARTDVVRPSIAEAEGKGSARLYSFRDLVALRVVAELRRAHLSLQRIRKCVDVLREQWCESLATARLLTDGKETYLVRDEQKAIALLLQTGQVVWRACVDVGGAAAEVRQAIKEQSAPNRQRRRAAGGAR